MLFLLSLCLTLPLCWHGSKFIKARSRALYVTTAVISLLTVAITHSGIAAQFPLFIRRWIWPLFSKGILATALFVIIMYVAVLPRGGRAVRTLLPIRGEMSIMACILTLGHNLAHVMTLVRPGRPGGAMFWAGICSLILMAIMLPLFVTSFPAIRRKMKARTWKKLQRVAYGFYTLVYVHALILGHSLENWGNLLVYSLVFLPYGILRIRKALSRKHPVAGRKVTVGLSVAAFALTGMMVFPFAAPQPPREPVAYSDGIYFGSAEGYVGTTEVAVTVADGAIKSVIVISSEDDTAYVEDAKALIPEVLQAQHPYLDAISGATYTSQALLEAIEEALKEATE